MNAYREKPLTASGETKEAHEQDPNFLAAKRKFEADIRPGIDAYFPKLAAFTEEILRIIERSGKTAVFIGRDGRWLFYIAKLFAKEQGGGPGDKIKFIDISTKYVTRRGDSSDDAPYSLGQLENEYNAYFKKLSINISRSFLVDVGFQGTIASDIRKVTDTTDNDDTLLVKSDLHLNPLTKGFYQGKTGPHGWDANVKMGHFVEKLPQVVLSVDELPRVRGGRLPKYEGKHDDLEVFLAQMTYQYLKKSVAEFEKNEKIRNASA
ncbi:MAG: hypothetical protein Q8P49_02600 [Candidatus Liptonbacteria bacterium]|nr:hypothetical protein [Candidatus Liptonbacteria bacterium]